MQQAGKTLVLALAFAASTSSASATVFAGSTTDPADRPTDPARDIKQISTSFDNVSGRWVGVVEFYGSPTPSTIAKVYLGLIESSLGTCVNLGGPGIRADIGIQQTSVGYAQPCSKPTNVPAPARSLSSDGRQLLVDVTDPDLIGTTPTASSATRLSQDNDYYDEVPQFPLRATGGPTQGPGSTAPATPTVIIGPGHRWRLTSNGDVKIPFQQISSTIRSRVRLVHTAGITRSPTGPSRCTPVCAAWSCTSARRRHVTSAPSPVPRHPSGSPSVKAVPRARESRRWSSFPPTGRKAVEPRRPCSVTGQPSPSRSC